MYRRGTCPRRYVATILFDVKPTDLGSLAVPIVAILAVLIPAARAAVSDPLVALRHD